MSFHVVLQYACGARQRTRIDQRPHPKWIHVYPQDRPSPVAKDSDREVWYFLSEVNGIPIYVAPEGSRGCHGEGRPCLAHCEQEPEKTFEVSPETMK